jgi:hypothetical protein
MTIEATPPRLEQLLASLLQVGTVMASVSIGLGLLCNPGGARVSFAVPEALSNLDLVTVGIIGFIILPVLRVVVMLLAYLYHRDILLGAISAAVLAIIVVGFVVGMAMSASPL